MGLDIYGHKIKHTRKNAEQLESGDWSQVSKAQEAECKAEMTKVYNKAIKVLEATDSDAYAAEYTKQIKKLCKLCNYPHFDLKSLGVEYDYKTGKYSYTPVPVETFKENFDAIIKAYYGYHVFYFRKVNFFYAYFQNKLEDEVAWVTKEDVEDIIDRCKKIIENPELGPTLLPTQSGFFFGSTEYDKYYIYDVKDCLKQMKSVLKYFKSEDDLMYVVMSW